MPVLLAVHRLPSLSDCHFRTPRACNCAGTRAATRAWRCCRRGSTWRSTAPSRWATGRWSPTSPRVRGEGLGGWPWQERGHVRLEQRRHQVAWGGMSSPADLQCSAPGPGATDSCHPLSLPGRLEDKSSLVRKEALRLLQVGGPPVVCAFLRCSVCMCACRDRPACQSHPWLQCPLP